MKYQANRCNSRTEAREISPAVTLAILGYNQEKYIEEAVEAALAQSYEPLEVILSDDCSSDRTLSIMSELAMRYRGPKKVLVRRTARNLGTFLHVLDIAKIAQGRLLVLAAGDDVSKIHRVQIVVDCWKATRAWGFYSRVDRVSENGVDITTCEDPRALFPPKYRLRNYFKDQRNIEIIHGATSAYDMRLFRYFNDNEASYILSEDWVLSVLLNMLGLPITLIDCSLVRYRQSENSLTNGKLDRPVTYKIIEQDEDKIVNFAKSHVNRCELFLRLARLYAEPSRPLDCYEILKDRDKNLARVNWANTKIYKKILFLVTNFDCEFYKWAIPRLLPFKIFLFVKFILRKCRIIR